MIYNLLMILSLVEKGELRSIPTLPAAIKARLQTLSSEVRGLWAVEDLRSTRIAINIEHKLLEAEEAIRSIFGKKRDVWGQFREFYFPEIDPRKAERCMHRARHIDLKAPLILFCLSQSSLDRLIDLAGKQDVLDYLSDYKVEVDPEMNLKNRQEVANFKKRVLGLISKLTADKGNGNSDRDHGKKDGKQAEPARRPKIRNQWITLRNQLIKWRNYLHR